MRVISFTMLVTVLAIVALSFMTLNHTLFFICVGAVAFCFGGNITVFPAIVGDFFGLKNHSKNYGIIYQGFGLGALAGSFVAKYFGGFHATFMVIGVLSAASLLITLFIKAPKAVEAKRQKPPRRRNWPKPDPRENDKGRNLRVAPLYYFISGLTDACPASGADARRHPAGPAGRALS